MPILGASLGAASGALGEAFTDIGINDQFMKELSANLQIGVRPSFCWYTMTTDKVPEAVKGSGGAVLKPPLTTQKSKRCAMRSELLPALGPRQMLRQQPSPLSLIDTSFSGNPEDSNQTGCWSAAMQDVQVDQLLSASLLCLT
jgi:hypothetical protein